MTRDVSGEVVKEWENLKAKMVYPPSGTSMETLLIKACQRNKKLIWVYRPLNAACKATEAANSEAVFAWA